MSYRMACSFWEHSAARSSCLRATIIRTRVPLSGPCFRKWSSFSVTAMVRGALLALEPVRDWGLCAAFGSAVNWLMVTIPVIVVLTSRFHAFIPLRLGSFLSAAPLVLGFFLTTPESPSFDPSLSMIWVRYDAALSELLSCPCALCMDMMPALGGRWGAGKGSTTPGPYDGGGARATEIDRRRQRRRRRRRQHPILDPHLASI